MNIARDKILLLEAVVRSEFEPLLVVDLNRRHRGRNSVVSLIGRITPVVNGLDAVLIVGGAIRRSSGKELRKVELDLRCEKIEAGRDTTHVEINNRAIPGSRSALDGEVLVAGGVRVRCQQCIATAVAITPPNRS